MEIGKSLQHYRMNNGMTQEQLAQILNVSRQTISKWENDRSFPDIENLIWLCDLYHISLDELVGRKQIVYETKSIRRKNKRKDLMSLFPKYTGIITALAVAILVLISGLGYYQQHREEAEIKEHGLVLRVYSVEDTTVDSQGMYDKLILENSEEIDATIKNIEKYKLESPVNKIKPNKTEKSTIQTLLDKKRIHK
ncbi:helix-turn-helix domain-containing protein [Enterococcus diestrammenae]|uniref:helix-turn-helix domain-containing protein n=1 Tax=Enterococcus diestrammenae TaxID=1155073 RepID=UPI0022E2BC50|nr:helix-turn-helix transcriptional regulator [Enterococcus diestrammenae]